MRQSTQKKNIKGRAIVPVNLNIRSNASSKNINHLLYNTLKVKRRKRLSISDNIWYRFMVWVPAFRRGATLWEGDIVRFNTLDFLSFYHRIHSTFLQPSQSVASRHFRNEINFDGKLFRFLLRHEMANEWALWMWRTHAHAPFCCNNTLRISFIINAFGRLVEVSRRTGRHTSVEKK